MSKKAQPAPTDKPRRKRSGCLIVLGLFAVVFVLLAALGAYQASQTRAELERADALWGAGKTGEAVAIYTRELVWVEDSRLPEAYERIITHHYDRGNAAAAAEWAGRAVEGGVVISFGRSDLSDVYAAAQRAVEARRVAEEARRAEERRLAKEREAQALAEKQRLAEEREKNKPNRAEMDRFYEVVTATDRHHVIAELDSDTLRTLTITVNDQWGALPHATRLEYARTFRGAWAGVWPAEPGGVKVGIKILDAAGRTIGGATWSEDAVWVEERKASASAVKEDELIPLDGNTPAELTQSLRRKIKEAIGAEGLAFTINNYFTDPRQLVIQVRFDIDDNLTDGFIRSGAKHDIVLILKAVDESGVNCHEVTVFGSFPLVDQYGNSSKDVVMKANYSGETIRRINWSNFLTDNTFKIADDVWLHPAFRE